MFLLFSDPPSCPGHTLFSIENSRSRATKWSPSWGIANPFEVKPNGEFWATGPTQIAPYHRYLSFMMVSYDFLHERSPVPRASSTLEDKL